MLACPVAEDLAESEVKTSMQVPQAIDASVAPVSGYSWVVRAREGP
jgi:hypothetical protein